MSSADFVNGLLAPQFVAERPPCGLVRGRLATVFRRRLGDMAAPAKRLQVVSVPRVAAVPERLNVVAFEPAGVPTSAAPPAVTLEDLAPDGRPATSVQPIVERAHGVKLLGRAS